MLAHLKRLMQRNQIQTCLMDCMAQAIQYNDAIMCLDMQTLMNSTVQRIVCSDMLYDKEI